MTSLDQYAGFFQGLKQADLVSIDTETTGLRVKEGEDYLQGLSIAYRVGGLLFSDYFPLRHAEGNLDGREVYDLLRQRLEGKSVIFHNRKFDFHSLDSYYRTPNPDRAWKDYPYILAGVARTYDTATLCHLLNENRPRVKRLEDCCQQYIKKGKVGKDPLQNFAKRFGWDAIPAELMAPYAKGDAEITLELFEHVYALFVKKFGEDADRLLKEDEQVSDTLYRMEAEGIGVDLKFCRQYSSIATMQMEEIEDELGFTPSKSTQLANFLFEDLNLPVLKYTPGGKPSMDKEVMEDYDRMLEMLDDNRARLVLDYRGWQKASSTFYHPFQHLSDSNGKVHCNFNQSGTVTGRLSCSEPNLQQIPRSSTKVWNGRIRTAFRATDGFSLLGFDYSQLELRLATAYGQDKWLVEEFIDPKGDPFTALSNRISTDRFTAKTYSYAMIYGAGQEKIAKTLRRQPHEIEESYNAFRASIPGILKVKSLSESKAKGRGYIRYWNGRRRHFYPDESYKAFNSLLQGGSAEVVKRVMVDIAENICDSNCFLLLQVHDELVFEIRQGHEEEYSKRIIEAMETFPTEYFGLPFRVAGKLWGEE